MTRPVGGPEARVERPFLVLAVVLSATFMQLVDISIVNTAIPAIQSDLGASFSSIQLVIAAYQLAFACTLITSARLGDIYGRRRLFLIGMTGFTLASALCGAAQSPSQLVIGRVLQGVLSGLMFPQVISVIQVIFEPRERGKAFGFFGATIGIATIAGPLLGGALIALDLFGTDWRAIFFVNVPIGVAAVTTAWRMLPESTAPGAERLDIKGALTVAVGLFLLVFPLTEGRERGWPAWVFAMLALSVPLLVGFFRYERRKTERADSPLLNTTLFHDRAFNAGMALSGTFFLGVAPFFFVFSLYLQIGHGFSALHAGLTTLPFAIGSAVAAANSDKLAKRIGRRILSLGCGLLAVSHTALLLSVHYAGTEMRSWQLWPALLCCGLGLGCFVGPVSNVVLAGVRREAAGSASGVISTAQLVAGAVGVAILGVLFFSLVGSNADRSSAGPALRLEQSLSAAGVPGPQAENAALVFRKCFDKRSRAVDPSKPVFVTGVTGSPALDELGRVPCDGSAAPQAQRAAFQRAADEALNRDYTRSLTQALIWEIAAFGLSFLLVFGVPAVDPRALAHAGPPAAE